jgi:cellulose biosynthesis protein BcsQ
MVILPDAPVVAVMNGKGGVGKSTLALGLCAYTAQTHGAGLLVDCDPQGTSFEITGLLTDPGYEVVHELDASQFDKTAQFAAAPTSACIQALAFSPPGTYSFRLRCMLQAPKDEGTA